MIISRFITCIKIVLFNRYSFILFSCFFVNIFFSVYSHSGCPERAKFLSCIDSPVLSDIEASVSELFTSIAYGSNVVIEEFQRKGKLSRELFDSFVGQFKTISFSNSKKNGFDILERKQLIAILKEKERAQIGITASNADIPMYGADFLIVGTLAETGNNLHYDLRIVDASTGAISNSVIGELPSMQLISNNISGSIKLLHINGDKIYIRVTSGRQDDDSFGTALSRKANAIKQNKKVLEEAMYNCDQIESSAVCDVTIKKVNFSYGSSVTIDYLIDY